MFIRPIVILSEFGGVKAELAERCLICKVVVQCPLERVQRNLLRSKNKLIKNSEVVCCTRNRANRTNDVEVFHTTKCPGTGTANRAIEEAVIGPQHARCLFIPFLATSPKAITRLFDFLPERYRKAIVHVVNA